MADPQDDLLAEATAALRARGDQADAPVDATRHRVLAAFTPAPARPRRLGALVFAFALGTGTFAWAAATGRVASTLERLGVSSPSHALDHALPTPARPATPAPAPVAVAVPDPVPVAVAVADPDPDPDPDPAPDPDPDPAPAPAPAPHPHRVVAPTPPPPPAPVAPAVDDDLAAYRRAHALHFHGGAPDDTLAAWDAYLAAFPHGRFAADARYDRAMVLIRLERLDEARAALAPFAAGEVEHGYRQREATELRAALEHR